MHYIELPVLQIVLQSITITNLVNGCIKEMLIHLNCNCTYQMKYVSVT